MVAGLVAAVLGLAAGAAPAGALPLLGEADAAELAQILADAEARQGVCYGWRIEVDDATGQFTGIEAGSSRGGAGVLDLSGCEESVVLTGRVVYTSESSERNDAAEIAIESTLEPPVTVEGLQRVGYSAEDLLDPENDDVNLFNMVSALPLLAAETGAVPYVPFEPGTAAVAADERLTDQPGSDWWRNYWPFVAVMAVVGIAGIAVAISVLRWLLRRRRGPGEGPPPAAPDPHPATDPHPGTDLDPHPTPGGS